MPLKLLALMGVAKNPYAGTGLLDQFLPIKTEKSSGGTLGPHGVLVGTEGAWVVVAHHHITGAMDSVELGVLLLKQRIKSLNSHLPKVI